MNVEHEDEEFVGLRVSGHTRQNSDTPPEFTGTKPSEFKNYCEKVRRWLLFTRTPAQLQGPHVMSRLTGQHGMPVTSWNSKMLPLQMG